MASPEKRFFPAPPDGAGADKETGVRRKKEGSLPPPLPTDLRFSKPSQPAAEADDETIPLDPEDLEEVKKPEAKPEPLVSDEVLARVRAAQEKMETDPTKPYIRLEGASDEDHEKTEPYVKLTDIPADNVEAELFDVDTTELDEEPVELPTRVPISMSKEGKHPSIITTVVADEANRYDESGDEVTNPRIIIPKAPAKKPEFFQGNSAAKLRARKRAQSRAARRAEDKAEAEKAAEARRKEEERAIPEPTDQSITTDAPEEKEAAFQKSAAAQRTARRRGGIRARARAKKEDEARAQQNGTVDDLMGSLNPPVRPDAQDNPTHDEEMVEEDDIIADVGTDDSEPADPLREDGRKGAWSSEGRVPVEVTLGALPDTATDSAHGPERGLRDDEPTVKVDQSDDKERISGEPWPTPVRELREQREQKKILAEIRAVSTADDDDVSPTGIDPENLPWPASSAAGNKDGRDVPRLNDIDLKRENVAAQLKHTHGIDVAAGPPGTITRMRAWFNADLRDLLSTYEKLSTAHRREAIRQAAREKQDREHQNKVREIRFKNGPIPGSSSSSKKTKRAA